MTRSRMLIIVFLFILMTAAAVPRASFYREIDRVGNCSGSKQIIMILGPENREPPKLDSGFPSLRVRYLEEIAGQGYYAVITTAIYPYGDTFGLTLDSEGNVLKCVRFAHSDVDFAYRADRGNLTFIFGTQMVDARTDIKSINLGITTMRPDGAQLENDYYGVELESDLRAISVRPGQVLYALVTDAPNRPEQLHLALLTTATKKIVTIDTGLRGGGLSVALAADGRGFAVVGKETGKEPATFFRLDAQGKISQRSELKLDEFSINDMIQVPGGFILAASGNGGHLYRMNEVGKILRMTGLDGAHPFRLTAMSGGDFVVHGTDGEDGVIAGYSDDLRPRFWEKAIKPGWSFNPSSYCIPTADGGSLSAFSLRSQDDKEIMVLLKLDCKGRIDDHQLSEQKAVAYAQRTGKVLQRIFIEYPAIAFIYIISGGDPMP